VLVKRRGSRARRLRGRIILPVGSTVDTTGGRVRLTSATCRAGRTQSGSFRGSAFVIRQDRRTAVTDLVLVGGVGACRGQTASIARRRRLFGNARGGFRTVGRYSAATVRGTRWVTEDTCQATTVEGQEGHTVVTARGDFPQTYRLDNPGDRVSLFCTGKGPATAPFYCLGMFKDAGERNTFSFNIAANIPPESNLFDVCVSGPGLSRCWSYQFGLDPGFHFLEIACTPRRAGVFTARWRVSRRVLGTLPSARLPGGGDNSCEDISDN
jgi:hypothetical protein